MSLRDDINTSVRKSAAEVNILDHASCASAVGYMAAMADVLKYASVHGIADGEDWKRRAEELEVAIEGYKDENRNLALEAAACRRKVAELEDKLAELFPDAPEEGIDEVA